MVAGLIARGRSVGSPTEFTLMLLAAAFSNVVSDEQFVKCIQVVHLTLDVIEKEEGK